MNRTKNQTIIFAFKNLMLGRGSHKKHGEGGNKDDDKIILIFDNLLVS